MRLDLFIIISPFAFFIAAAVALFNAELAKAGFFFALSAVTFWFLYVKKGYKRFTGN